jgi:Flp pilus assembly protein TadG
MLRRGANRRARCRRGVAAVEMAIVTSFVLIPATYGMIELSRAIQVKDALTDAARSGCRVGAKAGGSNSTITSNISTVLTANGFSSSLATITIKVNGVVQDASTAVQGDQLSVKVSVPDSSVNWLPALFLSSSAVESETLIMMRQGS